MANPTIKDVAHLANVSIATVSRVLNKNYTVSRELEQKVQNAIEELGYYPNSIARTLKGDTSKTIGFVVSDISNDFFTNMARAVEDVLNRHGYNLIVCSTDDDQLREYNYLQLLREKKVDGIIINTSGKNDEFIAKLSRTLPFVLFSRKVSDPTFVGDFVDNDNFSAIYDLTNYLLARGHRDIGLINGQKYVSTAQERQAGFEAAMHEAGATVGEDYPFYYHGHFSRITSGMHGAAALLKGPRRPTAIICANNLLTEGALQYCIEQGIEIPEEVSLCGFGTLRNYPLLKVQPTSAGQFRSSMSSRIAEMIMERIELKNELNNREVRYATHLVEGNSVRDLRGL